MEIGIKNIEMKEDEREVNKIRNDKGEIIGYKQSKCTCRITFDNGDFSVIHFEDLVEIIKLLCENEDKKYNAKENPNVLGRNMFLLYYLLPLFPYLKKNGFNPSERDIIKANLYGGKRKNGN